MTQLVERRAMAIYGLEVGLRPGDLHIVVRRHVEGPAASNGAARSEPLSFSNACDKSDLLAPEMAAA
jgi:hypothetical protein